MVVHRQWLASHCANSVEGFVDTHRLHATDVVCVTWLGMVDCGNRCFNAVVDVGICPTLLTVAVNGDGVTCFRLLQEAVVGHVWSLAGAVHREVSQHGEGQAEVVHVSESKFFGSQLGHAVRGVGVGGGVFSANGDSAIYRRGGNLDELLQRVVGGCLD